MDIKHTLKNSSNAPLALTIGNFDGVHIGHQAILNRLVTTAQENHLLPAAMTFSPHARALFQNCRNYLITGDTEKAELIAGCGIQQLYQIPFDRAFSRIEADEFIDLLIRQLNIRYLLVGDDFRFGHRGEGDFDLLVSKCQPHGIVVTHTPTIFYNGRRVSSSRVREAIRQADCLSVEALLGRPLSYRGKVIPGRKLGRMIAFPTANMRLPDRRLLPDGVFAVRVSIAGDKTVYYGMCNIGYKPTVDDSQTRQIETHLFDFCQTLYGQVITVEPIKKIRDEQTFDSVEALIEQLHRDQTNSQAVLATHGYI
ncbi:MAG: riboflavin biosynthesis protein RibF [Gammaproteobacteria bacterium]|nr:MAG: riboflavin biosynthesis protein RibF [Gammaproteobacteria bacterium]